jgi:DNA-binding HxlR family transcriptional regulator
MSPTPRKPTPRPGRPVRGSTTGNPLMALFDLLGRRWAITVIWTLRHGPMTFRELQAGADGIATSVLNTRLQELREVLLVTTGPDGYELTELGRALLPAADPLRAWAGVWAAGLEAAEKE